MPTLTPNQLDQALALRDLTDPGAGTHAMQHVVAALENALRDAWQIPVRRDAGPRVVPIIDNYDRLRYPAEAVTRDRRYTRYIDAERMLRSHTTARIPALLRVVAADGPDDVLLSVPGICYRRDVIDRTHVGEPHQLDLWRIRRTGPPLDDADLTEMVSVVVQAILPGSAWHTPPSPHPYTERGREIYASGVEIGECGLAHPRVLADAGLPAGTTGLAMGLGLDRLVMLGKDVDDIRLLRSTDPRIAGQMHDLSPYRPVSAMPAATRDLSIAVGEDVDEELLGDRVRQILGPAATALEEVVILGQTGYIDLPASARRRMGMRPSQKNVLLRLVIRDLSRTLTATEANGIRDRVYAGLHEGTEHEWSTS